MSDEKMVRPIEELAREAEELTSDEAEQAQGGLTITKATDSASPLFFKNCCTGAHYTDSSGQ